MHNRTPPLHVDVTRDGVVATVTVTGELDIATATTLCRHLLDVGATHPDRIVLDLDGMVFVDVAGARALDEMCHLLEVGCPVIVRRPRPSARMVFRLTGLVEDFRFTS
jgi:anti-anti-sigma factor